MKQKGEVALEQSETPMPTAVPERREVMDLVDEKQVGDTLQAWHKSHWIAPTPEMLPMGPSCQLFFSMRRFAAQGQCSRMLRTSGARTWAAMVFR